MYYWIILREEPQDSDLRIRRRRKSCFGWTSLGRALDYNSRD